MASEIDVPPGSPPVAVLPSISIEHRLKSLSLPLENGSLRRIRFIAVSIWMATSDCYLDMFGRARVEPRRCYDTIRHEQTRLAIARRVAAITAGCRRASVPRSIVAARQATRGHFQ